MMKKTFMPLLILVGMLSGPVTYAATDLDALQSAKSLLEARDAKQAYLLLEPLESDQAGNIEFDYLFAIAAIDSGNVTRGVFALERVLAINPNHAGARAMLARAYFELGEKETAKSEFQQLQQQQPSDEMAGVINRYLAAIDRSMGLTTSFAAYLDFGIGHDSNVSSATSTTNFVVPAFGNLIFRLAPGANEVSDNFKSISGGASFITPLNKDVSLFAGVSGVQRMNNQDTRFDTSSLDFNAGLRVRGHVDTFTLSGQAGTFYIDGEDFRRAYGATAQWQRNLDESNQLSVYGQMARLEYPGNDIRDADRYVIGTGWGHAFSGDKSPVLFVGAYTGMEDTRDNDFDFLGFDMYGLRAGGQLSFTPKLVGYATASYEIRDYDSEEPLFLKSREDKQADLAVGLRYLPGYNWTIRPQLTYINNDSNIVLSDYDRWMLSVNFRHDFNW